MLGTSVKIARLFGFDIRVHWSWILIFLLITWTFSVGILEEIFPDWATETRWATGAAVALVFFLSILFHELSHSIMARRFGIPISSITLFVFGGVSNLGREAETARQEFLVAVVGPLTSLGFAVVFGIAALAISPISDGVAAIAVNLAAINTAIAVFNMVPGFPLDGGRVLRSAVWARNQDLVKATEIAAKVGAGVGYGIVGLGILSFFFVSVVSGVWLFLIGNFLRIAADASYQSTLVQSLLGGVPASTLLHRRIPEVPPETTLRDLVDDYVLAGQGNLFPVTGDGGLLGVVSMESAREVSSDDWERTRVQDVMTPREEVTFVSPEEDLAQVLQTMSSEDLERMPVLRDGEFLGVIERGDVLNYIQTRQRLGTGSQRPRSKAAT